MSSGPVKRADFAWQNVDSLRFADHKRLQVMLVVSNLGYGGAERQVLALEQHLDRQRFAPHICILSSHAALATESELPVSLHVIAKRGRFDFTVVPRLAALLKRLRIDIVHAFLFDAEIAARLAGRLAGVRAVVGSERNSNYQRSGVQQAALRLTKPMND